MEVLIEYLNQQPLIGQITITVGLSSILVSLGLCIAQLAGLLGDIVRHHLDKVYLEGRYINTDELSRANSYLAKNERNDCTVLAWMSVFDVHYAEAHYQLENLFGRKEHGGVGRALYMYTFEELCDQGRTFNGKKIVTTTRHYNHIKGRTKTVKEYMKMEGTWSLCIHGHALAVVDGVLYDPIVSSLNLEVEFAAKVA